jgi:hypothetical protein
MNYQPLMDWVLTIFVLIMIFLLIYSSMRSQSLKDTIIEIKEIFQHRTEVIVDSLEGKYINK